MFTSIRSFALLMIGMHIAMGSLAHSPNQFTYYFEQQEDKASLQLHLTPQSAIDLLLELRPELDQQAIIKPNDHVGLISQYLNQKVVMNINGQSINLVFQAAKLGQHDAIMWFELSNFPGSFEGFDLQINAFTELYRQVWQEVSVPLAAGRKQWLLTESQRFCPAAQAMTSSQVKAMAMTSPILGYPFGLFTGLFGLGLLTWLGYRERKAFLAMARHGYF
ncbi:MAG: DUF6702 family protein [Bacteroidota bacterium]